MYNCSLTRLCLSYDLSILLQSRIHFDVQCLTQHSSRLKYDVWPGPNGFRYRIAHAFVWHATLACPRDVRSQGLLSPGKGESCSAFCLELDSQLMHNHSTPSTKRPWGHLQVGLFYHVLCKQSSEGGCRHMLPALLLVFIKFLLSQIILTAQALSFLGVPETQGACFSPYPAKYICIYIYKQVTCDDMNRNNLFKSKYRRVVFARVRTPLANTGECETIFRVHYGPSERLPERKNCSTTRKGQKHFGNRQALSRGWF